MLLDNIESGFKRKRLHTNPEPVLLQYMSCRYHFIKQEVFIIRFFVVYLSAIAQIRVLDVNKSVTFRLCKS